jgi:hypothetical protein
MRKSILSYGFLKRQSALHEEVRTGHLEKLQSLATEKLTKLTVHGWTAFTEAAHTLSHFREAKGARFIRGECKIFLPVQQNAALTQRGVPARLPSIIVAGPPPQRLGKEYCGEETILFSPTIKFKHWFCLTLCHES